MRPLLALLCLCALGTAESAPLGGRIAESPAGAVTIPPGSVGLEGADAALATLSAQAAAAGFTGGGWTLRRGLLIGWNLRDAERIVCSAGILRLEPSPADDAAQRRAALAGARDLAAAAIDPALPAVAADAVRAILRRLDGGDAKIDGLAPEEARRLAASPWLDGLVAVEAAAALRQALTRAGLHLGEAFSDGVNRLERHHDAFGGEVWIWRSATRCAYAMPVPGAEYRHHLASTLVVELPPEADPWQDANRATAARLQWGDLELARWDGTTVVSPPGTWTSSLAPWGRDLEPGWPAPHLVLSAPDGRVLRLLVGSLALEAPRDGGGDADAFITRAATTLASPELLPLLGDTFFTYAFDSPDPTHPRLVGDTQRNGDIHQTAAQTLATTLGGRFRGDCDDLAEIYLTVLTAQGRLAHVMNLPRHAAAGWLEHREGTDWRMHVLQSGPARCFAAATGDQAVTAAYNAMADRERPYRADQIAVLLRFAGENTRSEWQLSWRIYADPVYARTMIDVERDWHFRTYHHGVEAMLGLIASGDADPANHSELSGLYRRIGDWPNSIERHHQAGAARSGEPTIEDRLQELSLLVLGRFKERAQATATIMERQISELAKKDELRAIEMASALISRLPGEPYADLRNGLANRLVRPWFERVEPNIRTWLRDRFDGATWGSDRFARVFRVAGGILATQRVTPWSKAARAGEAPPVDLDSLRFLNWWYDEIAALPTSAQIDPAEAVTAAAAWLSLRIGPERMAQLVASARRPAEWDGKQVRFGGLLGAATVASWASVSVPWIAHDMSRAVMTPPGPARSAAVTGLLALLDEAHAFCTNHGLTDAETEATVARTRLLAALVEGDRQLLDGCLSDIARRADRHEMESSAGTIGAWAGQMTAERFTLVVERWFAVVDQHPFALEIAWRALHATRWDAAITAAKAAAQRYPDDRELVAEAGRIAALAETRRQSVPVDKPDETMWVP